jgi:hypothetical protein
MNLMRLEPYRDSRGRKGGALEAAEKPFHAVILSPFAVILIPPCGRRIFVISLRVNCAKDLALCILKAMRDSSSSRRAGLLRMTVATGFSPARLAPPFRAALSANCAGSVEVRIAVPVGVSTLTGSARRWLFFRGRCPRLLSCALAGREQRRSYPSACFNEPVARTCFVGPRLLGRAGKKSRRL